ncbi:polysaccharide deacetylase family protein [Histidinibacterium aquaticum]|uniref:NodB homology domain-containing protein n=1 Tax=Histidinibacterium aquaticum TaxID=2613962 RepID=A0A5J5GAC1_9RHOB|nr:hypothetical protein [Histidinibacterium aquaticum]KAA9005047.1 hypothetical protein F3S47_18635 [Histidinibacterium aquaticum]
MPPPIQDRESFHYDEYREILALYAGRLVDFADAPGRLDFVLLRHDVEFSLDRALALARVEAEAGVTSSFFVQVTSDAYNPAGPQGREALEEIRSLGHRIGLHFHRHGLEALGPAHEREFDLQVAILEGILDRAIDRFSFHRPAPWQLALREDSYRGRINAYGPSFFDVSPPPRAIRYCSDSRRRWAHGHPFDVTEEARVQILTHPCEWSDELRGTEGNFAAVSELATRRLEKTFSLECTHYPFEAE